MESMKCSQHTHIDYYIHSTDFIHSIAGYFHRCKISWKCCVCIRNIFRSFCFCVSRMLQLIMPSCVTPLCFAHSINFWETLTWLPTSQQFLRNINLVANK